MDIGADKERKEMESNENQASPQSTICPREFCAVDHNLGSRVVVNLAL